MSVLCKTLNSDNLDVYTKGAPEKILDLCRPETSKPLTEIKHLNKLINSIKIVPTNFNESLKQYTANGYRVIALAGKSLSQEISWTHASKLSRDNIESELDFHGFLIMQNMIKPETTPVITELKNASLKTVMVTGDNLLTALNVARKCGIVPKMNKVIFVEAHPPGEPNAEDEIQREFTPARIDWQLAEAFNDFEEINTSYQSNFPVI